MYELTDEVRIRGGRFMPNYGVNIAEHIAVTRRGLGFDQGKEYYAVEGSRITDTWNFFVTLAKGPVETPEPLQESGVSSQLSYNFSDTYKVGANGWSSATTTTNRRLGGIFASLGFSERFHLLSELDWRWMTVKATDSSQTGFFNYNRASYELTRGVLALATFEFSQTNLGDNTTANDRFGLGTQLFPRPHFDIQAMWTKMRPRGTMVLEDYAWLMLHYYL